MYEIVGNDSNLASYNYEKSTKIRIKSESSIVETPLEFSSLLDKLTQICSQTVPDKEVENILRSNTYFGALQSVFQGYKESLSLSFAGHEVTKLQDQSLALDRSLTDCISTIANTEKDETDESISKIEQSITDAYKILPKNINYLNEEIWKRRSKFQALLNQNKDIRSITNVDLENVDKCFQIQQLYWANNLKNHICNISMAATSYFLKRQRRRNFPKKATRILNEYFEAHMKHPYPDEATKIRLANACGVSIAQVSNWFGNKRIRFRKSLERQRGAKEKPTQRPSSP